MNKALLYFLALFYSISAKCQWATTNWRTRKPTLVTVYAKIICTDINSSNMQQELSTVNLVANSYEYIFTNSSIQNLPMNVFASKKIDVLYMNGTQIETIQTGAFSGLMQVREIYLQFNSITVVSRGCFNSLIKLKILNIGHNKINLIEDDSFHGSGELRSIFLNNNNITYIPTLLFESLTLLQVVDLSNNNIHRFDFVVSNAGSFESINLSNNKISVVNCTNLRSNFLRVVELGNNALTEVSGSCFPKTLDEFILNNNMITDVYNMSSLQNLKFLDLSNNLINNVDVDEFKNLSCLENIKLQNNKINTIAVGTFKYLTSLTSLNLSRNYINRLDFGIFNGLNNLNNLDLSFNQLGILEEDVFHNLNHLIILNVSYNNLSYVNLVKLNSFSKSLKYIDLIGNNISCQKLTSMFLYKLNAKLAEGSHHNVSNVNGIPCNNPNLPKPDDARLNNNMFKEIRMFFETDFKNTSFFKFFSENGDLQKYKTNSTEIIAIFEKYVENSDRKTQNFDRDLQQLIGQTSKNNSIFVVFTLLMVVLCALLLVLTVFLTKKLLRTRPMSLREPELHLL